MGCRSDLDGRLHRQSAEPTRLPTYLPGMSLAGFSCSGEKAAYRSFTEGTPLLDIERGMLVQRELASYRTACPPKAYCPEGSIEPTPCPPNFYCPGETVGPIACPANHYCPDEAETPQPCPKGYFCPGGEEEPFTCPPGSRVCRVCADR